MINYQCLHCGGELTAIHPPWLSCPACSHAYLATDLDRAQLRAEVAKQKADIAACMREDQHRGKPGGSSSKSYGKDDKLKSKSLRQVTWQEDTGSKLIASAKIAPKDTFLAIRGISSADTDAVRIAIERELREEDRWA